MTDKPLHVQVAEAIGCQVLTKGTVTGTLRYRCGCEEDGHGGAMWDSLLRYDTDWSATGPLLERFRLRLGFGHRAIADGDWWAHGQDLRGQWGYGETPLVAICNLILTLYAAGKLPK